MSFKNTMSNYCFVECDRPGCNKKMEHVDQKVLKKLAAVCGWEKRGDEWACPECVEKIRSRKYPRKRSRRHLKAA